ncbi:MAG: hypothetical protein M1820_005749 [Bogoriella megaspora]|nr:MAG: hypothetical protein M1820_005749 [Bogoriella megaspora]
MRKTVHPSPTPANINTPRDNTAESVDSASSTSSESPGRSITEVNPTTSTTRTGKVPSTRPSADSDKGSSSTEDDSEDNADTGLEESEMSGEEAVKSREVGGAQFSATEGADLERLREVMQTRMHFGQQAMRKKRLPGDSSPAGHGSKGVSPINEETIGAVSPSLDAAFASPLPTNVTTSTESTESARTVRGSVPATPSQQPMRTPSYPFPYIPGTPLSWSSSFHQPFTALSPTISGANVESGSTPRDNVMSDPATPVFSSTTFLPHHPSETRGDTPHYPSPSLYDLTLTLNTEPGMDAWWANVVAIMNTHFLAERISLSVPADPSDLENVPWGQKASFAVHPVYNHKHQQGLRDPNTVSHLKSQSEVSPRHPRQTNYQEGAKVMQAGQTINRPGLKARHSYAGHERQRKTPPQAGKATPPSRPSGPQRTASHAPQSQTRKSPNTNESTDAATSSSPSLGSSLDPDFSMHSSDVPQGPVSDIFHLLRSLDFESQPLIDTSGINRVLERGKLVTLTREYANKTQENSGDGVGVSLEEGPRPIVIPAKPRAQATTTARYAQTSGNPVLRSDHRHILGTLDSPEPTRPTLYEEYEQYSDSPWAQSPAPSPAIQVDPEENPFFASSGEGQIDEESFNPSGSGEDYSRSGQVEAIGVDKSSTVIHLPLVHPMLSQNIPIRPQTKGHRHSKYQSQKDEGATVLPSGTEGKAPIAILSLLSSTVPFPQNLSQCLKLLGPHLATSFSNAAQYTNVHNQATERRHRQRNSGHHVGFAPIPAEGLALEDLKHQLEIGDIPETFSETITSPSDYSGRSRLSPSGSIAGTPGWENVGTAGTRSRPATPHMAAPDKIDSYFDAKKVRTEWSGATHGQLPFRSPGQSGMPSPKLEYQFGAHKQSASSARDDGTPTPKSEEIQRNRRISHEKPASISKLSRGGDTSRQTEVTLPRKGQDSGDVSQTTGKHHRRPHSLLHSYGADFTASFQNLPAATTTPRTPTVSHSRSASFNEDPDMLPPSERLLRTIIDALPVQVFTATPGTGDLTWVNTKFLVYRGQNAKEVLEQPWDAVHAEDKADYMEAWQRSLKTGQQLQHKVRLQRFDGSYRWFYARAAPLKDKRQNIVHWIGTNMDFHEQHIAEMNSAKQQETAASEAKYRALANSSPQIVFAVTRTKGLIFCNTQWVNYSGQSEANALGLGFMEMVHPDDIAKCKLPTFDESGQNATNVPTSAPPQPQRSLSSYSSSAGSSETEKQLSSPPLSAKSPIVTFPPPQHKLSQLASTGFLHASKDSDGRPSYSTEVRLRSRDGDYKWHLVRIIQAEPIAQTEADEETWYGTCTDINAHKALERDMKESMDAKTRFLSNMSHEIRTPLNGITGMVNFLIDSRLSSEQMEHVSIIKSSTEGLRDLINDILDLSKAEAGAIKLVMDWIHIRSLIEEVNDLTSALAIDKGLELNYLVEEDVPSMLKGDKFRLRQVLLNVVGNAIKFTERGEVFVRCQVYTDDSVRLSSDETLLLFEVIDTGSGFTPKEAEALFKRFSQIDGSSTRQHGGTGLGLVISKQLVNLHGGEMTAKGEPGKGSTFNFYIKFTIPTDEDHPPQQPLTPRTTPVPLKTPSLASIASRTSKISPPLSSPKTMGEITALNRIKSSSPSPLSPADGHDSPTVSSGSSDPSIRTQTSMQSARSSVSSFAPEAIKRTSSPMKLELPTDAQRAPTPGGVTPGGYSSGSGESTGTIKPELGSTPRVLSPTPPVYSILVVCPLAHSQLATIRHIQMTIPKDIPHAITARDSFEDYQEMGDGPEPPMFSHIVLVLKEGREVLAFMHQLLRNGNNTTTSLVVICDLTQKREIMQEDKDYDFEQLQKERRLRFIFKPLKPSKFAIVFDPQKEREVSTDRNQDTAQQNADRLAAVNSEMMDRLGNKGHRVLLVEDNKINQMVLVKLFRRCNIPCETVFDGVQCTSKVFEKPPKYYTIILCDLHMPNKDGYQTCRDIRQREKQSNLSAIPIIALSANVLGDVYTKCAEVGFNAYVTKPVEFEQLKNIMVDLLDPDNPTRPLPFMKVSKHRHGAHARGSSHH